VAWEHSRPTHVPARIRSEMLDRDGHQCRATVQRTGQRCTETGSLEAHELTRWYRGKTVLVEDLLTLCHFHHNLVTQQQEAQARKASPPPRDTRPPVRHPGLR
jgi:hypothetical protein